MAERSRGSGMRRLLAAGGLWCFVSGHCFWAKAVGDGSQSAGVGGGEESSVDGWSVW